MQNSANFSQLIYLVISFHLLRQLGNLGSGLIQIFPSLVISGISVSLVWFISGIFSDSEGISHVKHLFWLQTPWLKVVLTMFRSISALNLHRLQCGQNSLARSVAYTTKYSYITPVRKSLHSLPINYHCFQDSPIGVQVSK